MMVRKYVLLVISLFLLAAILEWGTLLFLFMSLVVVCVNNLNSHKKVFCTISVLLFILGFFIVKVQYTKGMMLLWGYSVFAFSGIAFLVDQYRNKRDYSVVDTLLYLFFVPKIFAGPIVRPHEFIPQLSLKATSNGDQLYKAFKITIYALFLKFFIADNLAIEEDAYGINLLMGSLVWGIRFYFDFYAYSLLAVGIALFCGIELPYNFDNPYSSKTFREFWKRWNITLSAWLRDYIYIPLGVNRNGRVNTCLNVLVVFIVSGLWHGLTMPFLVWGLCHAMLVIVEKTLAIPTKGIMHHVYNVFVMMTTMLLWQLFRFNNFGDAFSYSNRLCNNSHIDNSIIVLFIISLFLLTIIESKAVKALIFERQEKKSKVFCEVALFTLILAAFALIPNHYSFNFFYLNF